MTLYDGMTSEQFLEVQAMAKRRPLLSFWVEGDPVPKGRPRVVNGHAHTPKRTQDWEDVVAWFARYEMAQRGCDILTEPLSITLYFAYGNRGADLDNLIKTVLDALNGVVWEDDVQIDAITAMVQRGVPKGKRGVMISIELR